MFFIVSNSEAVAIKEEAKAAPVKKGMSLFASIFSVISCEANQVSAS